MQTPPKPINEAERLATLHALKILDTPPEERFDRLTRLATRTFRVPIALISLIDEDRQWFKSCQGLPILETSRDISFCGHAILQEKPTVIPDALLDPRFCDNPLVVGPPYIRFYAGQPLHAPNGLKLGTLCIIDQEPRQFEEDDLSALKDLGALVEEELAITSLVNAYRTSEADIEIQKELNRIKDQSLSIASHELRNPLTTIRGFAQLLQINLAKGQKAISEGKFTFFDDFERTIWKVDTILRQANRMDRLVREILDVSQIQKNNSLSINRQPNINLVDLVTRLVEQQEQSWPGYTVKLVIQDEPSQGNWDEERIEQVLVNLINNAAKFSPVDSHIEIGVKFSLPEEGDTFGAICWVKDEGYGIDERDRDHLFELFYQAKDRLITKNDGLGLGLFISNQIILQHGGRMWLESKLEEGSTFYFFLPYS